MRMTASLLTRRTLATKSLIAAAELAPPVGLFGLQTKKSPAPSAFAAIAARSSDPDASTGSA